METSYYIGTLRESHICTTQFPWKSTEYAMFKQKWNPQYHR